MNVKNTIKKHWFRTLIIFSLLFYFGYKYMYEDYSYSSFIEKAKYSPFSNALKITINGISYKYCYVPSMLWKKYKNADSKGSFYNSLIKGKYNCSENSGNKLSYDNDEWVFDHIIPLCLGGGDFRSSSHENFSEYNFNVSNELATSCFDNMVKTEQNTLENLGFQRLSDGSWVDAENNYPSCELESEMELNLTKEFQKCIN